MRTKYFSVVGLGCFVAIAACTPQQRPEREIAYHATSAEPALLGEGVFEVTVAEATYGGAPTSIEAVVVLENEGYVVGYSEARRNPLWGAYRLFPIEGEPVRHDRPSSFHIDDRTTARVKHDCYTGSGYDRGHVAPNSAIDTRYGEDAQYETFAMSNAVPQSCQNNREPWQGFEAVVENQYAMEYPEIFVINGPIFDDSPDVLDFEVEVPSAFYKVVVEPNSTGQPRVLAIVMAQEDTGWHRQTNEFTTTVDCVELLTGLDFFPDLDDSMQDSIESSQPDEFWDLDTVLRPTRFGCPGDGVTAATIAAGNARRAQILAPCD